MRCWHKDLIHVLPRQQLLGQWRECCSIAKNIKEDGSPNHVLVNRINDYPIAHFWKYAFMVSSEMQRRGYKCGFEDFQKKYFGGYSFALQVKYEALFSGWHNNRYLRQCYYNLQEKYDCGAISKEEWGLVESEMKKRREHYDGF